MPSKKVRDLTDIRNGSDEVRTHNHHHEDGACCCGHHHHEHGDACGHEHSHEPEYKHGHGEAHTHEGHEHDNCCGEEHGHHHHGCGDEQHHHEHGHDECGCGHEHHHEHQHGESCGCGEHHHHEREDSCGCGHEHHHSHHVPGHPDDCRCEICHPHEEYCDVCGESLENCTCRMPDAHCVKKVYILKNLGCAHCAAKMEHRIKELPGVEYANISYVTKQLRLSAVNHEAVLPAIKEICTSIESGVEVVPREGEEPFNFKTQIYVLENLGCANCAAKMERAINELPQVSEATITFATKQLKVTARDFDGLLPQMQKICSGIESGVVVKEREGAAVLAPHVEERKRGSFSLSSETMTLAELVVGGVLFIAAEFLGLIPEACYLYVLVAAYVLLGGRVVLAAVKNLLSGNLFDENFLMTIATLGAFVISAYEEAVGVMFFYRVGEYFEHRAVEKSRGQIMDAVDMRPETVNLLVGEEVRIIPAADAHVGDILLVRAGDRIPLDGVVIEGDSLVDTSPVTGEPVPVRKHYGDEITSGCINTNGMLKIRVEKVLSESMVTRILDSVENAAASKPQIDRFITRFARVYTPFVVVVATLTALVPGYITGNWQHWIYTALTFLVISCPCALVLSVPLAFFSGIGAGSRYGILFKGGSVMEALKNVHAVVMDKTGTVTKGNFVVQKVMPAPGVDETDVLQLCADVEAISAHPIAVSIVNAAKERGLMPVRPVSFNEIAGEGIVAQTLNGTVICGSKKLMARYKISCGGFENSAYGTEVLLAQNGRYMGHIVIADTIKDDAVEAVKEIKAMGLTTAMLTGDAEASAQGVAAAAGIDEVRAKLLPQDKLNELGRLRSKYGSVMFVGDGINDAPVLAGADVGAAMGSGADAALEAADVVFMKSEMRAIPQAINIARRTGRIAWQNVIFALGVKAVIMVAGLAGFASMWAAVFADTGVAMLCVINSIRILYQKN